MGTAKELKVAWHISKLCSVGLSAIVAIWAATSEAQKADNSVVTDVESIRWPIGPKDQLRIITLHIPLSYLWRPGASLKATVPRSIERGSTNDSYTSYFVLEALLPNFESRNAGNANEFAEGTTGKTITIAIGASINGDRSSTDGTPLIDSAFRRTRAALVTDYDRKHHAAVLATKPDRFGLKHEGAVEDFEKYKCDVGMTHDIYYPASDPKETFIICGAEEIRDVSEDPKWCRKPICVQEFYSPSLRARVDLQYRRIYLKDWQELQQRTERLLSSLERTQ
jgi:hypothetical protein